MLYRFFYLCIYIVIIIYLFCVLLSLNLLFTFYIFIFYQLCTCLMIIKSAYALQDKTLKVNDAWINVSYEIDDDILRHLIISVSCHRVSCDVNGLAVCLARILRECMFVTIAGIAIFILPAVVKTSFVPTVGPFVVVMCNVIMLV